MPAPSAQQLASQRIASGVLAEMRRATARLALAEHVAAPSDGERCWRLLAETPTFDAWLIAWGGSSEIHAHDHGDSAGALAVVRGGLVELYREPNREGTGAAPWVARELTARTAIEVPKHRIHHVANPGPEIAVSLHVYSPPLSDITFHEDLAARPGTPVGAAR